MSETGCRQPLVHHPSLLSPFLFAMSLLYGTAVRARNGMYDAGILRQSRLAGPVISVGNLTAGGSGKTPFVIYLAAAIHRLGATPVLLSRGYGRSDKTPKVLAPGEEARNPACTLGDEPALMRRHAPYLWLGVSRNRHALGVQISRRAVRPVFILDDGFQHRRLGRSLDIVLVDRTQPLAENRLLPAGTLREPLGGLRRADVVVINGPSPHPQRDPLTVILKAVRPDLLIFHCVQRIERLITFDRWRDNDLDVGSWGHALPAYVVAAIANPARFQRDVQSLGIDVKGSRFYRDHRSLGRRDWNACAAAARSHHADVIITTEKDAIKLVEAFDFPLLVAVQSTAVEEHAEFERLLAATTEVAN